MLEWLSDGEKVPTHLDELREGFPKRGCIEGREKIWGQGVLGGGHHMDKWQG
jgi:hypothetical protein